MNSINTRAGQLLISYNGLDIHHVMEDSFRGTFRFSVDKHDILNEEKQFDIRELSQYSSEWYPINLNDHEGQWKEWREQHGNKELGFFKSIIKIAIENEEVYFPHGETNSSKEVITANSSVQSKRDALNHVNKALNSLNYLTEVKLDTRATLQAVADLGIFQKQLIGYINKPTNVKASVGNKVPKIRL